jgi:phage terminase large subunit
MEIRIQLQPKQIEFAEAIEDSPITFFGGARGGGKSHGLRSIMLMRRFQYPGSTGAIFRKTYPELEANHIRPIFQAYPALRAFWNESKKLLSLPNGSTLQFCHCASEADVDLYQGREFHDLAIDEAGQWTEGMFRTLLGSNRSSKPGVKARAMLTGNPGGVGHTWLKRLFVERRFSDRERPKDYQFIRSLVDDNQALLDNDPDYIHRLESEPNEAVRRAFRYGDWDIFAGQFFGEIDRDVHFIKPFAIPSHWARSGAYDFGYNHPAAFGWFAVDGDGNIYMYRELVQAQLRVDQFIEKIKAHPDTQALERIIAGLDCWAVKGVTKSGIPPTIAEEFLEAGLVLSRAITDRIQGANQVRQYLAWRDRPNQKPKLFIFNTCPITFDTISRMQTDPNRIEDVLKQDSSDGDPGSGDDAYDMIRYFLMSRPFLANAAPIPKKNSAEWFKAEEEAMFQNILDKQNDAKREHFDLFGEV